MQLNFDIEYTYADSDDGIVIPVILGFGGNTIRTQGCVDCGASYCIFTNEVGRQLGLNIENGIPKSFGPGLDGVPMVLNHAGPRSMIGGTRHNVSTLLITVGRANAPAIAGNGGLFLGQPRFPSSASSKPVSSPQIYAPAPRCT